MVTSHLPRVMQDGRTVPTAEVHKLMLDAIQLQPGEKVLEVGTGSATTAVELATACCECLCDGCQGQVASYDFPVMEFKHCGDHELCRQVELHTIELQPVYGETINVEDLDIYFHVGDGKLGLEQEAPFDCIVVTCGCEHVPEAWQVQLKEGGRLILPIGTPAAQRLVLMSKTQGTMRLEKVVAYVRFSMMKEEVA